ncbi:MAG: hypothetical protein ACRDTD_07395 [Pseudonocardiaceae bacterium]
MKRRAGTSSDVKDRGQLDPDAHHAGRGSLVPDNLRQAPWGAADDDQLVPS